MPYKDPEKQKLAQRKSYEKHRTAYAAKRMSPEAQASRHSWGVAHRARVVKMVNEAKAKPCADCKEEYPPYVMDFDHVRGEKLGSVSWLVSNRYGIQMILDEIKKCDVVCSNCHRERTYGAKSYEP